MPPGRGRQPSAQPPPSLRPNSLRSCHIDTHREYARLVGCTPAGHSRMTCLGRVAAHCPWLDIARRWWSMLETDKTTVAAPQRLQQFASHGRGLIPGVVVAALVALAASWLSEHYHAPVMLFALLLGIAMNFVSAGCALPARYRFRVAHGVASGRRLARDAHHVRTAAVAGFRRARPDILSRWR